MAFVCLHMIFNLGLIFGLSVNETCNRAKLARMRTKRRKLINDKKQLELNKKLAELAVKKAMINPMMFKKNLLKKKEPKMEAIKEAEEGME